MPSSEHPSMAAPFQICGRGSTESLDANGSQVFTSPANRCGETMESAQSGGAHTRSGAMVGGGNEWICGAFIEPDTTASRHLPSPQPALADTPGVSAALSGSAWLDAGLSRRLPLQQGRARRGGECAAQGLHNVGTECAARIAMLAQSIIEFRNNINRRHPTGPDLLSCALRQVSKRAMITRHAAAIPPLSSNLLNMCGTCRI